MFWVGVTAAPSRTAAQANLAPPPGHWQQLLMLQLHGQLSACCRQSSSCLKAQVINQPGCTTNNCTTQLQLRAPSLLRKVPH